MTTEHEHRGETAGDTRHGTIRQKDGTQETERGHAALMPTITTDRGRKFRSSAETYSAPSGSVVYRYAGEGRALRPKWRPPGFRLDTKPRRLTSVIRGVVSPGPALSAILSIKSKT